jgi:hypothetical protein
MTRPGRAAASSPPPGCRPPVPLALYAETACPVVMTVGSRRAECRILRAEADERRGRANHAYRRFPRTSALRPTVAYARAQPKIVGSLRASRWLAAGWLRIGKAGASAGARAAASGPIWAACSPASKPARPSAIVATSAVTSSLSSNSSASSAGGNAGLARRRARLRRRADTTGILPADCRKTSWPARPIRTRLVLIPRACSLIPSA